MDVTQLMMDESYSKEVMVGYDYDFNEEVVSSCFIDNVEVFSIKDIVNFLMSDNDIDMGRRKSSVEMLRKANLVWVLNKWEIKKTGLVPSHTAYSFTNRDGLITILSVVKTTEEKSDFLIKKIIEIDTTKPIILKRSLKYELVSIENLNFDTHYQRGISEMKVREIVRKFDIGVIGALIVSVREDGKYYVIDGQHRIQAMKLLNIKEIMCVVHHGISIAEEALMFSKCNTTRKSPSALDNYKALLVASDNETILLNNAVEESGYSVDFHNQPVKADGNNKYTLRCVGAMRTVVKSTGVDGLKQVLRIFHSIGNERPIQIEVLGMGIFIRKANCQFDESELIKKLMNTSKADLIAKTRQMSDLMNMHSTTAYAHMVLQILNTKKQNKLTFDK